jgi:uncharacterized protein YndB with AHSA1/START domain
MSVHRSVIELAAPPDRVYAHFVRPELLVRWMGDWAALEAEPGGQFAVDINGVIIRGAYVRLEPPTYLEIAWGEAGNPAMPPGATRLCIRLTPTPTGTRLELEHTGLVPEEATKHAIGWPHFLERLVISAAGEDPGRDPWATSGSTGAAVPR